MTRHRSAPAPAPAPAIAPAPVPVPATLAEQKADFTAEGSPPPGWVATAVPVSAHDTAKGGTAPLAAPVHKKP